VAERPAKPKHKPARSGRDDDRGGGRSRGELHLTDAERARRGKGKRAGAGRRSVDVSRLPASQHGFSRPTQPVVREVAIGDSIVVSELAQKMAVKGAEVVKALFKMGVMATINQTIDHDTAALVVEEMGHNPVRASERDAEEQLISHIEAPEGERKARPPVVT